MLEPLRDVADGLRELAVDGIARAAGGRRVVGFVEDQQRAGTELAQQVSQASDVGLVGEEPV